MIDLGMGVWDAFFIVVVPLLVFAVVAFWLIERSGNGG